MRFKNYIAVALVPLLIAGCSGSKQRLNKAAASLGGEVVEAEGIAPYKATDIPGSKAASLAAAQKAAVELVVGVYVNAKTRVDKAVAIENTILTQTKGYVKKYDILKEGPDGEWYRTRIRALVDTQDIRGDLDSLGVMRPRTLASPRVALFIQEWMGEKRDEGHNASRALTQVLIDRGFNVVEVPASFKSEEDPGELAKKLPHSMADILISGLARAQSLGYGKEFGGLYSYRASVSLRAIEVGTSDVLLTVSETASGLETSPELAAGKALSNAAESTGKDFSSLPDEIDKRSRNTITINGIKSFDALSQFQKNVLGIPGVKDLSLRSFSQENGVAEIEVQTGVSPQELAEQAVKKAGDSWSVYQVSGHSIQLSASQAGR